MVGTIPLNKDSVADNPEQDRLRGDGTREVLSDLAYKQLAIVNVVFYGEPGCGDDKWVLIDAGLFGTADIIQNAARERFGGDGRPFAIVMTHGHFDHVGVLERLAERWDVPVFAHPTEFPFLDGRQSYPPPDPSVGGGLIATLSPLFPREPVNVGSRLKPLPRDLASAGMPGWTYIETPGHTAGHVSFWRERDRALIAGDAFVTTKQESVYAAVTQSPEIQGPPAYFTPDWTAARDSVRRLAELRPETVITGHGAAMHGPEMREALATLARDFERIAVPEHRRAELGPAHRP
jgi:glyoxylase-like metal-dependent hydrolase (beta-lactamase superfamily II)